MMNARTARAKSVVPWCVCGCVTTCLWIMLAAKAAAELRPSWECLPSDTALMIRVPDPGKFMETIGTRTKFGAVMMQPQRWQKIGTLVFEQIGKDAGTNVVEKFRKDLGQYGLAPEELPAAFSGDFGAALVTHARPEGGQPNAMLLGWLGTADEAAAKRLFDAAGRMVGDAIERRSDEEFPPKRNDVEMAGRPVLWAEFPLVGEQERIGTALVFVARIDDRLLVGASPVASGGQIQLKIGAGDGGLKFETEAGKGEKSEEEARREAEVATDEVRSLFESFLSRHAEPDGEYPLADLLNAPSMKAAVPAGVPLVEVVVDPRAMSNMLRDAANSAAMALAPFGLDATGPIGWWQTLDGDVWRSNLFVTLPAPRRGLMRMLDEESDRPEVPSFVTREAFGFQQVSLDLGKAYALLREAVLAGEEPPPGNAFGTAEMSSKAMLGIELPALLSAFGTRHWFIGYPPRIAQAIAHARRARAAGETAAEPPPNPSPSAVVWQVKDEAPFKKLLPLAAKTVGTEVVDEQGFQSVRFPGETAVFLGQGHLVVALGEGVAEKTLSAIRNPPADDAAFRTSDAVKRGSELVPPVPGGLYGVRDNSKTGGLFGTIVTVLAAMSPDDFPEKSRGFFESLQAALPSVEEMDGMLGADTMLLQATDQGVLLRSACDMPAP